MALSTTLGAASYGAPSYLNGSQDQKQAGTKPDVKTQKSDASGAVAACAKDKLSHKPTVKGVNFSAAASVKNQGGKANTFAAMAFSPTAGLSAATASGVSSNPQFSDDIKAQMDLVLKSDDFDPPVVLGNYALDDEGDDVIPGSHGRVARYFQIDNGSNPNKPFILKFVEDTPIDRAKIKKAVQLMKKFKHNRHVQKYVETLRYNKFIVMVSEDHGPTLATKFPTLDIPKLKKVSAQILKFVAKLHHENIAYPNLQIDDICYSNGKIVVIDWEDAVKQPSLTDIHENLKSVADCIFELFTGEIVDTENFDAFVELAQKRHKNQLTDKDLKKLCVLLQALKNGPQMTAKRALAILENRFIIPVQFGKYHLDDDEGKSREVLPGQGGAIARYFVGNDPYIIKFSEQTSKIKNAIKFMMRLKNDLHVQRFVEALNYEDRIAVVSPDHGPNLKQQISDLKISELKDIAKKILLFVIELHRLKIAHNDLQVENFCYKDGEIIVLDWDEAAENPSPAQVRQELQDIAGVMFELFTDELLDEDNLEEFTPLTKARHPNKFAQGEVEKLYAFVHALKTNPQITAEKALAQLALGDAKQA